MQNNTILLATIFCFEKVTFSFKKLCYHSKFIIVILTTYYFTLLSINF